MQERLLIVYYGVDRLPYKDENREVHYPIISSSTGGTLITGENNTSKLYFYVGKIGGSGRQWIANIKKPDGTLSYLLCTNGQSVTLENGEEDYRVELDIASLFADQVGDVYIGVQGYSGDTVIVENDGTYEISGNPIVIATGTIKIKVNYAPSVLPKGETLSPTTEQLILAALSGFAVITNTIMVVSTVVGLDLSIYEDGQILFAKTEKRFYRVDNNYLYHMALELDHCVVNGVSLVSILDSKANDGDVVHIAGQETITGSKIFTGAIYKNSISEDNVIATLKDIDDKIAESIGGVYRFKGSVATYDDLPTSGLTIGDVYNVEDTGANYAWTGTTWDSLGGVADMSNYYTKSETYNKTEIDTALGGKVDKTTSTNKVYATDGSGNQATLSYDSSSATASSVAQRNASGQIVTATPTGDTHAATKKYVDDSVSNVIEIAEGKCRTYIFDYGKSAPTTDAGAQLLYKPNGEHFEDLFDFLQYVGNLTLGNAEFNSQNNLIAIDTSTNYFIDHNNVVLILDSQDAPLNDGDIILIAETYVPDRWAAKGAGYYWSFRKLETTKIDLTDVAKTNQTNTFTQPQIFGNVSVDKLNPNASNYGLTLPDTTSFTADKEIATTEQAFNVINANDIVNNTLTQAQYDLITNGKPTLIVGELRSLTNPFLMPGKDDGSGYYGKVTGQLVNTGSETVYTSYVIATNKIIEFRFNAGEIRIDGRYYTVKIGNGRPASKISVAGKNLPDYPSNTGTFNFRSVGGTLAYKALGSYVADNTITELSYDDISVISISADTTFTLKTPASDSLPEYKAKITNSHSTDSIDLTFPSGTIIKTNDSSIVITSNVLTLPSGTTIELNIQDGHCIAFNWDI